MGGNALKNTTTRRYTADEYFALVDEILLKTNKLHAVSRLEVIPAYNEKTSFGDMDILYSVFDGSALHVQNIVDLFQPNEIVKNGDVISFDYKELQIDLIFTPEEKFDYALSYFSWNDLGNLTGKLAKRFNLSHGHKGLYLPLRDEAGNKYDSILITEDHDRALKFVGLDPEVFNAGFDNLQQIFEFVASSVNYSSEWYKLENVSSIGRIRDKKRTTYQEFLKFGENWTGIPASKVEDKSVFLKQIFEHFPEALPAFEAAVHKHTIKRMLKEKFNGDLVSSWTKLKGQELGIFMKVLRKDFFFSPEILLYLTLERIERNVMHYMVKYYDIYSG